MVNKNKKKHTFAGQYEAQVKLLNKKGNIKTSQKIIFSTYDNFNYGQFMMT